MFHVCKAFFRTSFAAFWAVVILTCCAVLAPDLQAQETGQPGPGAQHTQTSGVPENEASTDGRNPAPTVNPGVFYDKDLDLAFNYPVEMRTLDMRPDLESGHKNVFGVSGENDPEHQEMVRCTRPLLDAELPLNKAPKRMASLEGVVADDSKEDRNAAKPEPIFAKIVLVEFDRGCVPKKALKKEDDVLASMARSGVALPGIQLMEKPLWYEIGKQKIHMNFGGGRAAVNGHVASSPMIAMAMATQWRGHLLEWVFTSNDAEIFNEITKSIVRFGNGPWGPMFPANVGPKGSSGTPMTILPK
jgi:hypothetical protein